MRYFSVPADFKEETLEALANLNSQYEDAKIIEVYGQKIDGAIINSGRVTDALPQISNEQFVDYVRRAKEKNINFNYTLNPACFGNFEFSEQGIRQIQGLFRELEGYGIDAFTLTSPSIMELCRKLNPKLKIKASAICEINSPMKALFYKNLGAERVVVDPDITRDFRKLKNICQVTGSGVEIIINNVCLRNCPYKMFHYNHEAHNTKNSGQEITDFFTNRCSLQKAKKIENIIKLNWIRPEDLKFYEACGIQYFKIQGRQNVVQGDLINTLKAYFERSYEGNLFDLITLFAPYNSFQCYIDNKKLDGFVEAMYKNDGFCTEICDQCNYCNSFAKKSINIEKAEDLNKKATQFFESLDSYQKMLEQPTTNELLSLQNIDFDI